MNPDEGYDKWLQDYVDESKKKLFITVKRMKNSDKKLGDPRTREYNPNLIDLSLKDLIVLMKIGCDPSRSLDDYEYGDKIISDWYGLIRKIAATLKKCKDRTEVVLKLNEFLAQSNQI